MSGLRIRNNEPECWKDAKNPTCDDSDTVIYSYFNHSESDPIFSREAVFSPKNHNYTEQNVEENDRNR